MKRIWPGVCGAVVALSASPAQAQTVQAQPVQAQTAQAQTVPSAEAAAMRAQIDALRAQVEALEARLNAATGQAAAPALMPVVVIGTPAPTPATPSPASTRIAATSPAAPTSAAPTSAAPTSARPTSVTTAPATPAPAPITTEFRGATEFRTESGWSFKPRGRLHLDVGDISTPGALASTRNLGTNVRVRRVRLGADGAIPGGFGYTFDIDFANAITFGNVYLSYDFAEGFMVRLGNFEPLDGLEQISSSNNTSFLERAAFNDAFLNSRRLGAAVAWQNSANQVRAEAGLFAAHSIDGSFDNNGYIAAGRLTYSPQAFGGQLHFGANIQRRQFSDNAGGAPTSGANQPSTGQLARYRARPNSQLTDVRFIDTGSFAARGDTIVGVEAAAIFPGFYFAGEAQWLRTRAYRGGATLTGLDGFGGTNSAVVTATNPGFFGFYGEVGYFITGETRGFRNSIWSRTRVLLPLVGGGPGAFQLMARIDHVDLSDAALQAGLTNNFTSGATTLAANSARLGRGGIQTGYLFGVNWYPADYVRFMVNYGRVDVQGGPLAAQVDPLSALPVNDRDYGVDVLAARLQLEF